MREVLVVRATCCPDARSAQEATRSERAFASCRIHVGSPDNLLSGCAQRTRGSPEERAPRAASCGHASRDHPDNELSGIS